MKKVAIIILFLFMLFPVISSYSRLFYHTVPSPCIALVLKINGDGIDVNSIEPFSFSLFNGKVKESYLKKPSSDLNILVQDQNGEQIFNGFCENPLMRLIESFKPDGTIKRLDIKRKADYINFRFRIGENVKKIYIKCYRLIPGKDKIMISEFTLDLK